MRIPAAPYARPIRTEAALVSAAHFNFLGSFRKLADHAAGGEFRYVGTVFAFVTGVPAPLLNGCVLIDDCDPAALEEALLWVARSRLPFRVFVAGQPATALTAVLAAHSISWDADPYPGMVLHPLPEPPVRPADIEIADGLEPGLATYLPQSFPDDAEVRVFRRGSTISRRVYRLRSALATCLVSMASKLRRSFAGGASARLSPDASGAATRSFFKPLRQGCRFTSEWASAPSCAT